MFFVLTVHTIPSVNLSYNRTFHFTDRAEYESFRDSLPSGTNFTEGFVRAYTADGARQEFNDDMEAWG